MFLVPNLEEIRQQILRDVQSLQPDADISVDSDFYVRASALAAAAMGVYAHQKWLIKQFFLDTADTEFLEKHAALRGIKRRNATYASGFGAQVIGKTGSVVARGLQIKTEDNRFYETISEAVLNAEGTAFVKVRSLSMGSAQNITTETKASFMSAPRGVQSDVVLNQVIGATDAETDTSLLERLLERIRRPAAGGNKYDYKRWALDVDGVDAAYVYPLRRGLGTVDIAITANNDLPSDETLARVQRYIDEVRPVTARESKVVKPDVTKVNFDILVRLNGGSLLEIKQAITTALADYFNILIPGDELVISQCEALISNLVGVVDRRLVSPTANRQADVVSKIEWFRLGVVNVAEMGNS